VGAKGEKVWFMPFVPSACSASPHPAAASTPTAKPRNPVRAGLVTLLLLVAAVVLTGCIKVDLNLALHEDNTASGTVLFAVQDSVAQQLGTTPADLWAQVEGEITQDWPAGTQREPYASGGYTGTRLTIPDAPLAEMDDVTGQPLSIQRQGDEFFISGEMDLNQLALEEGAQQQWIEGMQAQISITCPGRVTETNGTVTGNTVTWTPTTDGVNQFTARCDAVPDLAPTDMTDVAGPAVAATEGATAAPIEEGVPRWIPALGLGFVLALAALAWALWHRSHQHEQEYLGLAQFDDAAHGQFGYDVHRGGAGYGEPTGGSGYGDRGGVYGEHPDGFAVGEHAMGDDYGRYPDGFGVGEHGVDDSELYGPTYLGG